jgi:hypothetical protein
MVGVGVRGVWRGAVVGLATERVVAEGVAVGIAAVLGDSGREKTSNEDVTTRSSAPTPTVAQRIRMDRAADRPSFMSIGSRTIGTTSAVAVPA